MNCKEVENNIVGYIEGVLPEKDAVLMQKHISVCEICTELFKKTEEILNALESVPEAVPSKKLRTSFYSMLEEEKQLQPEVISLETKSKVSWKTAFQIAASIVFLFAGYTFGTYTMRQNSKQEIVNLIKETTVLKQDMLLAMIDNRSPSKRIKAVNITEEFVKPNAKVLEALINRMQYDSNSNVRLAAAEAIAKFTESEKVKTALISALSSEKNPSIQIEIIHILVKIQDKRAIEPMKKLLEEPETPNYVKEQVNAGIAHLI
ncbi:MAG: HEAT repeat domain-containing protein [Cellulophaga sp.]